MTHGEFVVELWRVCLEFPAGTDRAPVRPCRDAILKLVGKLTDAELDVIIQTRVDEVRVPGKDSAKLPRALPKAIYRAASECLLREREGRIMGWKHEPKQRTAWDWITEVV